MPSKNREKRIQNSKEGYQRLKKEILIYYGNGKLVCVKCGFNDIRALTIDHIKGGGHKHRKKQGVNSGIEFYCWLRKNSFPSGYQTLCANCQSIKRIENRECYKK